MDSWKTKTMIIATTIGAVSGALAGYILVRRSEELNQLPKLSAGDGVKIGLGVLGLLRLIADFAAED
jgi:hypothetical protein